ncbi:hypothetical protein ABZU75_09075 [Streptosporangium sp. NPDC005286]|uniref:GntT/GntP/DsdX family permease n=1 Tax=Streptosporangium sp. NPDC005286 TaxID=3154463 RepID=UPI0033B5C48A
MSTVLIMLAEPATTSPGRLVPAALAGLSVMHGLVPPHPDRWFAIDALKADLGIALGLGVLIAVPTVAIAGPLFSRYAAQWTEPVHITHGPGPDQP